MTNRQLHFETYIPKRRQKDYFKRDKQILFGSAIYILRQCGFKWKDIGQMYNKTLPTMRKWYKMGEAKIKDAT